MKIYFIEKDFNNSKYLNAYFSENRNVKIINSDLESLMKKYDIECIACGSDSFGLMKSDYDKEILDLYGKNVQDKIQKFIIDNYNAEQPITTSFIIEIDGTDKCLIHTPPTRLQEKIIDERVVYQCMRTTLLLAKRNRIQSIVIPMFGLYKGQLEPQRIARLMRQAYDQIDNKVTEINWEYANKIRFDI